MNEEFKQYQDPEQYSGNSSEKIDFKNILLKHLDLLRFERARIINKNQIDDSNYINAATTFEILLTTYIDEIYKTEMKDFIGNIKLPRMKKRLEYYDKMFKELLFLCKRMRLIGGDTIVY